MISPLSKPQINLEAIVANLILSHASDTNRTITKEFFGGNAVYERNTDDGVPDPSFMEATKALEMWALRYPAGQPDVAYMDGMIIDGKLPQHTVSFMEAAQANNQKVVIVTPTHAAYRGADEIGVFVRLLVEKFPNQIHAFEIGNEYWYHQTEVSYGKVANDTVIAIAKSLDAGGSDYPIWVQMGDAGGIGSMFHPTKSDLSWGNRNIQANETIIEQLSDRAKNEIDGVVEHFYMRNPDRILPIDYIDPQLIKLDYSIWGSHFQNDLTLNITEWNIRTTNTDQLGVRAASSLLAQFKYIIEMDIDEAYVWPPQHNTATDLAGADEVSYDRQTGLVSNSPAGTAFDMLSSNVVGHNFFDTAVSGGSSDLMHFVFASSGSLVVYLTSRSNEIEEVNFSLGDFWSEAVLSSAIQVGYDKDTSDGIHYNFQDRAWAIANSLQVNGEDYFTNEHDVGSKITDLHINSDQRFGSFDVTLLPYEIVQLKYDLTDLIVFEGSDSTDHFLGTDANELYNLNGGDDVVNSGSGDDRVFGGAGDDFINLGQGSDFGVGGNGNDTLKGFGNDDTLEGSDGDDRLEGGAGNDHLKGGAGNDMLYDGVGADLMDGGSGDDTFHLRSEGRYQSGWAHNISSEEQTGTGVFISLANYGKLETVSLGGGGIDSIELNDGADAFFLNDAFSEFHEAVKLSSDSAGNLSAPRMGQIERIDAHAGNDLIDLTSPDYSLKGQTITIHAGSGDDIVWGSDADEIIFGGLGADTLFGGTGNDVLYGGGGADVFEFTETSRTTQIADFNIAEGDSIRIYQSGRSQVDIGSLEFDKSTISIKFTDPSTSGNQWMRIELPSANDIEDLLTGGFFEVL